MPLRIAPRTLASSASHTAPAVSARPGAKVRNPQRRPHTNSSLVAPSVRIASRFGCAFASRREQRLRHRRTAQVVEQAEVGVVEDRHQLRAALGLGDQGPCDRLALGLGRHVAGGVVREVEQHRELVAAARVPLERLGEAGAGEALPRVEREGRDLGALAHGVGERVVVPQLVGEQDQIARVDEQVAHQREPVGDRRGHDRQRERLAAQRRILEQHLLAPALAQRGLAGRRGVVEGLAGRARRAGGRRSRAGTSARRPRWRCRWWRSCGAPSASPRPTATGSPSGSTAGGPAPTAWRPPRARRPRCAGSARRRAGSASLRGASGPRRAGGAKIYRGRCSTSTNGPKPDARQKACAAELPAATRTSTRTAPRSRAHAVPASTSARPMPRRRADSRT